MTYYKKLPQSEDTFTYKSGYISTNSPSPGGGFQIYTDCDNI